MPLYEYQCNNCEHTFEIFQRTNNAKKTHKCPTCGTEDTKKRFSSFAAVGTQKSTIKDNST